jgi:ubiquitin carboxyl-terminal hydrolase 36/42
MVDAMHEACLRPLKDRLPKELTNTTFVYRIFGGRLRSQVRGWRVHSGSSSPS